VKAKPKKSKVISGTVEDLYDRPGFLIRRAHQIAVSLFLAEAEQKVPGITTTQFGAMIILRAKGSLDQTSLSRLVGMDRSTAALVVTKLEASGYIERKEDPHDKRRKNLVLTPAGHAALQKLAGPAESSKDQILSVFNERDAEIFIQLLKKLVNASNDLARAPLSSQTD
jgi:MarR family transcriptional regulator, lower aerobic nicotinate degradation pathway regulator